MQRILHVVNGEFYSGAERVQDHLAARLPEFGFEAHFACVKPGLFPETTVAAPETVHLFPMRSRLDLRPAWAMAAFIRKHDMALVHTHTPRAAMVGSLAARLTGRPVVHHLHSPAMADTETKGRNQRLALMEKICTRGARKFVAVSERTARWYLDRGVKPARMAVVYNGVPVGGPLPERKPPQESWTIGTVALFRPRKGLETLIESLALLKARGHAARLLAVGDFETEDYRSAIHGQCAGLGVDAMIDWAGFSKDAPARMAEMDCMALPSLFGEGLPMVVLEAMAVGTPVVATRVEGTPEAIRDGVDGLLTEPGDPNDLANALEALLSDSVRWAAFRASAHARQQQRFSDRSMAEGVARVYQEVLQQ